MPLEHQVRHALGPSQRMAGAPAQWKDHRDAAIALALAAGVSSMVLARLVASIDFGYLDTTVNFYLIWFGIGIVLIGVSTWVDRHPRVAGTAMMLLGLAIPVAGFAYWAEIDYPVTVEAAVVGLMVLGSVVVALSAGAQALEGARCRHLVPEPPGPSFS